MLVRALSLQPNVDKRDAKKNYGKDYRKNGNGLFHPSFGAIDIATLGSTKNTGKSAFFVLDEDQGRQNDCKNYLQNGYCLNHKK